MFVLVLTLTAVVMGLQAWRRSRLAAGVAPWG
jgi:hypothetical protein